MTTFLIPLDNTPQTFQITLAAVNYTMTVRWNDAMDAGWVMDLANADSGLSVAANIPFVTGVDMLSGLEYLGIDGQLFVFTDGDDLAVPTLDNLGQESNLYFLTDVVDGAA